MIRLEILEMRWSTIDRLGKRICRTVNCKLSCFKSPFERVNSYVTIYSLRSFRQILQFHSFSELIKFFLPCWIFLSSFFKVEWQVERMANRSFDALTRWRLQFQNSSSSAFARKRHEFDHETYLRSNALIKKYIYIYIYIFFFYRKNNNFLLYKNGNFLFLSIKRQRIESRIFFGSRMLGYSRKTRWNCAFRSAKCKKAVKA